MRYSVTRIFSRTCFILFVAAAAPTAKSDHFADNGSFVSAADAYRQGVAARKSKDVKRALGALEYAARHGVLLAKLELAQMFAEGDGVPRSHAQAFYYFESVANDFAEMDPRRRVASRVAHAFVAVGEYYRDGIDEIYLRPNPARAARFFKHAASYFGDAAAQYNLARLYLAGEGVTKNVRLAVNWLTSAAKKEYAPAQAVLGDLLWRGDAAVGRQPAEGLALLALARLNAQKSGTDLPWIEKLYEQALAKAAPDQRRTATDTAARWVGKTPSPSPAAASGADAAVPVTPQSPSGEGGPKPGIAPKGAAR